MNKRKPRIEERQAIQWSTERKQKDK